MLRVNNLSFAYSKSRSLFNSINMELELGNIYGLLGKNGAGKSTLLKILSGLLYPQQGEVLLNGRRTSDREPILLSDIYMLPEEFDLPDFTINDYIQNFSRFYPKYDHEKLKAILEEFEVDYSGNLKRLSYGQKKKFMISFAIATNCAVIFMDEPTNGLDIPSKSKFRKIIASTIDEKRMYIVSTHQVRDLENLIDPVMIVDQGSLIFNYTIDEIVSKLSFVKHQEKDLQGTKVFYEEAVFGGYYLLTEHLEEEETPVDFELLFNAILANKEEIVEHLNR